jgi:hypothetical protein
LDIKSLKRQQRSVLMVKDAAGQGSAVSMIPRNFRTSLHSSVGIGAGAVESLI